MKLKRIFTTILVTLLVAQFSLILLGSNVYAIEGKSFQTTISTVNQKTQFIPGEVFEVKINLSKFQNVEEGLYAISGQLDYNKETLELIPVNNKILIASNGWEQIDENATNLKFITTGNKVGEGTLATIKFKVKENINTNTTAKIMVKDIQASDGNLITCQDVELSLNIVMPIPSLTSKIYQIQDNLISKVPLQTTVKTFKQNVTVQHGQLEIKNKDGKILADTDIIGTGASIKVGSNLNFTVIVEKDIDGDGKLTSNDLAKLKMHIIELPGKALTGVYFTAADLDNDKTITANDVARLKIAIIGKI